MRVLLINGSSKSRGCTYTALSVVADNLETYGIHTEIFQIGTKSIRGCIGCSRCVQSQECIFQDDVLHELYPKIKMADGFVFGSPVYFASGNGSMISLMDRLFYTCRDLWHKPAACVVSARRAGTTAALDVLMKYPSNRNMPIVSSQYWNMVHGNTPGEVLRDEEGMQTMRTLAQNMAWLLRCIEAGKHAGIDVPVIEEKIKTNFISLEKTPTSISGEYRNKYVSVGVQSPTEIKASGGLQECADENVSKADAHSAARTQEAFLRIPESDI